MVKMKPINNFSNKTYLNFYISILIFCLLSLILTGCGIRDNKMGGPEGGEFMQTTSYRANLNCNNENIIQYINKTVQGAKVLPVDFKPNAGTALEKILGLGGSICVVGIQEAAIGVQITYLNNASSIFKDQIPNWMADNYITQSSGTLNPVFNEVQYLLSLENSKVSELHSMSAQVLYKGVWISISASYIYEKVDMDKLVDMVLGEVLVSEAISLRVNLELPQRLSSLVKMEDLLIGSSEDPQSIALLNEGAEEVYTINAKKSSQSYYSNLATLVLVSSKVYDNSSDAELTFGKKIADTGLWVLALGGPYVENFNNTEVEVLEIADLLLISNTFHINNR